MKNLHYDDNKTLNHNIEVDNPSANSKRANPSGLDAIIKSIQEFSTLSRLLRVTGALLILAAMGSFLLNELDGASDLSRFYWMLGQTFTLGLIGVVLSFFIKEQKGGRAFFNLSLFSVIANVTTLGALIYSNIQWNGQLAGEYPLFSDWHMGDANSLFMPILYSVAIFIPVAGFAFSVMARQSAKALTLLLAMNSLLLVLPIRDSLSISFLVALGGIISFLWVKKITNNQSSFRTFEGRLAISIVFLPLAIMLVRSFWLYQVDTTFYWFLSLALFSGLRVIAKMMNHQLTIIKQCVDWLSVACAFFVATISTDLFLGFIDYSITGSVFSAVFIPLIVYIARDAGNKKGMFISFASIALILTHCLQITVFSNSLSALLCMVAGLLVIYFGKLSQKQYLLNLGLITAIIGLILSLVFLFNGINFNHWLSMTVIGITTIVAASLIERYGAMLKLKWSQWRQLEQS